MPAKISTAQVRADFNDPVAVVHYARAAHFLGLWHLGYRDLTAFDFAEELLDQARHLAAEQGVSAIRFLHADATKLSSTLSAGAAATACSFHPSPLTLHSSFAGALFLFNGLMQIPGREQRRAALRELHAVCRPGAPLLFTTHDRDVSPTERALWRLEKLRWENGTQDPRLVDFGDRYFEDDTGRTFMHLPDRAEILADLAATGWTHTFDSLRRDLAKESRAVRDFSDECRFWSATRAG